MGKLYKLEVENFKSYKGTQTIGPFRNFQSILGPNGTGKSNLMDAISFVLGVKTGKLRGANLRDLVFKEGPEGPDPNLRCSVKLYYHVEDEKNTQVVFARTILPGKHSSSEYSINGKNVKPEEYDERLKSFGILVKARNFLVFQGDVEAIASKSPKDLTLLIEQISGSDELREKYESLKQEKDKAEENTIYNYQKKKGINAEKKQFKVQKEEAEKFQKLNQDKNGLQIEHTLFQLYHIDKDLDEYNTRLVQKKKQAIELQAKQDKLEKQLRDKKKEQATMNNQSKDVEKRIQQRLKQDDDKRAATHKFETQIQHTKKRIETSEKSAQKINQEYEKHLADIASLERELKSLDVEEREFKERLEKVEQISFSEAQIEEYNRKKELVFKETVKQQQQLTQLTRQQKQDQETRDSLESKLNELQTRKKQLEANMQQLVERKNKMSAFIEENVQNQKELTKKLNDLRQANKENSERQNKLTDDLEAIQEQLREAKSEVRQSERDIRLNETVEALKRLFPAVRGKLFDLCKTSQKKYNIAVTVAMGQSMDAIVVDDEKTATECVQYMKEQRAGTATFIPLDKIKVRPINEKYRMLGKTVKPVIDVLQYVKHQTFRNAIRFDPNIQKAVLYAVGNTLVCDTVDEARRLAFGEETGEKNKVVTINGTLIHKSGLMTGGLSGIEQRAGRWDEKRLEDLKRQRDKILKELADLGRSLRSVDQEQQMASQIAGLETRIKYSNVDLELTESRIEKNRNEQDVVNSEINKVNPDLKKLTKSMANRENEINEISSEVYKIEDRIFSDFCAKVGVANIREYEGTQLKLAKEQTEKKLRLASQRSKLENQLSYERQRDLQTPKSLLEKSIADDKKELKSLEKQLEQAKKVDNEAKKEVDELKTRNQELKLQLEKVDQEIREIKKQSTTQGHDLGTFQKQAAGFENHIEQLKTQRHNLVRRVKVEQLELPIREDMEPMEIEDIDTTDTQALRSVFQQEESFVNSLNFDGLSDKKRNARTPQQRDRYNEKYLEKIQNISAEMDKISPNMRAIERFDDVVKRMEETNNQFEDSRQTARDTGNKFLETKKKRTERFMAAFTKISESIDQIYKDITRHGGSRAYLTLENLEEPYLEGIKYNAIPPNKRFRDMDQLSGGEKTVAALALLFAIHSYQPSPFFILDEIDAALDPGNVNRVVNYLKHRAQDLQLVVISHKSTLSERADSLIGIYQDKKEKSSKTLTLDLTKYPE